MTNTVNTTGARPVPRSFSLAKLSPEARALALRTVRRVGNDVVRPDAAAIAQGQMAVGHDPAPIAEHLEMHTLSELMQLQGFTDAFAADDNATPPRTIAWTSPACRYFAGRR